MYREDSDYGRWAAPSQPSHADESTQTPTDDNSPQRLLWEMGLVIGIPLLAATILSFVFPHIPY